MKNKTVGPGHYNNLLDRIANILVEARRKVVREINKAQVLAYREVGREIIEFEQKGRTRAEYGEELIKRLSKDMTEKSGKGFSDRNLEQMRKFYLPFSQKPQTLSAIPAIRQTVSDEFKPMLSWSHYCDCDLLKVEEPRAGSL